MLVRVVTDRCDNSLYTVNDHFTRLALIHFSEAAPTSRHTSNGSWILGSASTPDRATSVLQITSKAH